MPDPLNGLAALLNGRTLRATRPLHFFRRDGSMPEELEMAVTIPPELGLAGDVLAELRERVRAVEDERCAERQRTGRRVLGRCACSRSRGASGRRGASRGGTCGRRSPRRASGRGSRRWCAIGPSAEYADARERWRAGVPAVFPPGTYWLQRFASVTVLET